MAQPHVVKEFFVNHQIDSSIELHKKLCYKTR